MEAAQHETVGTAKNLMGASNTISNPPTPPAMAEHHGSPKFVAALSPSAKKRMNAVNSQISVKKNASPGVSSCYIFKSRLQEYAQKAGILPPVYETIKEGPSHEPSFKSSVIVDNVRYDSLPGFFNRKAAEQSAAEVALRELASSADMKFGISQPVHETGLCKNLLQEYAQKMNYAIPSYECHLDKKSGRKPMYSCVLDIGGIKYIGASASTKKEAEIKVARTALLAIQSATSSPEDHIDIYTVIPHKKTVTDLGISIQETAAALKPKKSHFKKQWKKKYAVRKCNFVQGNPTGGLDINANCQIESNATGSVSSQLNRDTDPLEVNMDRLEVPQVSVTGVVGSQVETPVGPGGLTVSVVETPVGPSGLTVSVVETPVGPGGLTVSVVETPIGPGELVVTSGDGFQEPNSGLSVMEETSNFCSAGSCGPNLENDLILVDKGCCNDRESTAPDVHS